MKKKAGRIEFETDSNCNKTHDKYREKDGYADRARNTLFM